MKLLVKYGFKNKKKKFMNNCSYIAINTLNFSIFRSAILQQMRTEFVVNLLFITAKCEPVLSSICYHLAIGESCKIIFLIFFKEPTITPDADPVFI